MPHLCQALEETDEYRSPGLGEVWEEGQSIYWELRADVHLGTIQVLCMDKYRLEELPGRGTAIVGGDQHIWEWRQRQQWRETEEIPCHAERAHQQIQAACETFDVRGKQHIQIPKLYTSSVTWDPHHYRLVQDSQPLDLSKALSSMHAKNVFTMRLKSRQNLQSPTSSHTTILVELSCEEGQGLNYLPGKHLGVCPGNQPALVQGILEQVVDGPAPPQTVCLEALDESSEPWAREPVLPGILQSPHLTEGLGLGLPVTTIPVLPAERVGCQNLM
ncbi:hypothetical protein H8959_019407 [Pygathrix nigripes]